MTAPAGPFIAFRNVFTFDRPLFTSDTFSTKENVEYFSKVSATLEIAVLYCAAEAALSIASASQPRNVNCKRKNATRYLADDPILKYLGSALANI